ncbi:TlpA family protein disulfide reductase [Nitratireductor sp. GCM10026969]
MSAYGMQGTPTLILIDRKGRCRAQHFGHVPDLRLGAEIMALIAQGGDAEPAAASANAEFSAGCGEAGCLVPDKERNRSA